MKIEALEEWKAYLKGEADYEKGSHYERCKAKITLAALAHYEAMQPIEINGVIEPNFGDKMVFQHLNMWGEPCHNIYEYTYANKMGRYPDYTHRFCRIGDASVSKDGFDDLLLDVRKYKIGEKGLLGIIKSYTRHDPVLDAVEKVLGGVE